MVCSCPLRCSSVVALCITIGNVAADSCMKKRMGERGEWYGSPWHCPIRGCHVLFVHCCPPRCWQWHGPASFVKKGKREGGESCCSPQCCLSIIVVYHVADNNMAPTYCVKKGERESWHVAHLDIVNCSSLSYIIVICPLLVATSPSPGFCVREVSHGGRCPCSPQLVISVHRCMLSFMSRNGFSVWKSSPVQSFGAQHLRP